MAKKTVRMAKVKKCCNKENKIVGNHCCNELLHYCQSKDKDFAIYRMKCYQSCKRLYIEIPIPQVPYRLEVDYCPYCGFKSPYISDMELLEEMKKQG